MTVMYDAVTITNIPVEATLLAAYIDGIYANQAAMRARYPHARIITITVTGLPGADFCDCETGDLTPAQAIAWAVSERAHGRRGGIYASKATWDSGDLDRAPGERWQAHYDGDPTIPAGYVAKQYLTGNFDVSSVADGWPDPPPTHTLEEEVFIAAHPTAEGYWIAKPDGSVESFGASKYHGGGNNMKDAQGQPAPMAAPCAGIAATPTGGGYWLIDTQGHVYSFGDAQWLGNVK